MRFDEPTQGIWSLRIYGNLAVNRRFHIWLPMTPFISDQTYFLRPDPDVTLSDAACASEGISVAAYNDTNNSLYAASGRGFTADYEIKRIWQHRECRYTDRFRETDSGPRQEQAWLRHKRPVRQLC